MLTIENTNKILHKTLGKKNFYVARVEESIIYDPMTFGRQSRYIFELTNRKYATTVSLERDPNGRDGNWDYKLFSSSGNVLYIKHSDIRNMDIFLDKLRFVGVD